MSTILIVDDKEMLRDSVGITLQRAGYTVTTASNGAQALQSIAKKRPDAVVTDLKMPGMTGVELLEKVRAFDRDLPVVLMTAYGTIETAVKAMRLGAYTYITKPFEGDELVVSVKRAIEHSKLKRENEVLKRTIASQRPAVREGEPTPRGLDRLVGDAPVMRRLKEDILSIASSQSTALIHGESGVGKEVVAQAVHEISSRSDEPFLAVNCAALSESLLESELFGHEKGSFTGADQLRKGRFELADRGTLLLDEISEVSLTIQAKLLRALQERAFERVGSSVTLGVDVRVLATTNRNLEAEVARGEFRQDLFFRLNVLPIHVPALRDRREDIPQLAEHFIDQICVREGRENLRITPAAIDLLWQYDWPGNVRELQNICERAVVLTKSEVIEAGLIRDWLGASTVIVTNGLAPPARRAQPRLRLTPFAENSSAQINADSFPQSNPVNNNGVRMLEEIERQAIIEALDHFNGHRQKTAAALGIGVRTLGLKLKKWKELQIVSPSL